MPPAVLLPAQANDLIQFVNVEAKPGYVAGGNDGANDLTIAYLQATQSRATWVGFLNASNEIRGALCGMRGKQPQSVYLAYFGVGQGIGLQAIRAQRDAICAFLFDLIPDNWTVDVWAHNNAVIAHEFLSVTFQVAVPIADGTAYYATSQHLKAVT